MRRVSAIRVSARYLQGSYPTYYHGTYLEDARAIQKGGFRPAKARGRGAFMGPGLYIGNRKFAEGYAEEIRDWEGKDAGLLHLRINPAKPLLSDPAKWPGEFKDAYQKRFGTTPARWEDVEWPDAGPLAKRMGYDAIVDEGGGTTVVFDPKRITVLKIDELPVAPARVTASNLQKFSAHPLFNKYKPLLDELGVTFHSSSRKNIMVLKDSEGREIGKALISIGTKREDLTDDCLADLEFLESEVGKKLGVHEMFEIELGPKWRGKGLGKMLYELALYNAARNGSALVANLCTGGGLTSWMAKEVWNSIGKNHPSVGYTAYF